MTVADSAITQTIDLIACYERMLLIRRFEQRLLELHGSEIQGSIHLCLGQEAIPVGVRAGLQDGDRAVATYRGHGWALAWGLPLQEVLAEITGRATGINGGRGGSAYMIAHEYGFLGENSIVGAGLPIAAGAALAAKLRQTGLVCAVSFGDGATNQGAAHEAIVLAVARKLPVLFICENNQWSEMTPISETVPVTLRERAAGYGLTALEVDGNDPAAVAAATASAAENARNGLGPTFLEMRTARLGAHYQGDIQHYRTKDDIEAAEAADPLLRLRERLLEHGHSTSTLDELEERVLRELGSAEAEALAAPHARGTSRSFVYRETPRGIATPLAPDAVEISYAEAVNAALSRELGERAELIVYGEDIAGPGGTFGITRGLQKLAGEERVFDTPISEAAILGSAIGAAIEGMRPVVEIMFGDFLFVAFDQLVNQAANISYISRGQAPGALLVRTQQALTPGACAQHAQSLEALVAHIPGLRIGLPGTPQDAYAMTRAAIASADPVLLYESRALYQTKGPVALDAPVEELGGARLLRAGTDLTIVSWSRMATEALAAAEQLAAEGINAAVLDLRWLNPLDENQIYSLVNQTARVLIAHEANLTAGFGAEITARVVEHCFSNLDAPPHRVALPDTVIPAAPTLQAELLPQRDSIVAAAKDLVGY